MTDELEQRMRAADPVPASAPVDPAGSSQAQTLVERIMTDQIIPLEAPARPGRGRWLIAAAAAAALVVGVIVVAGGDDDGATSSLALSVPADDAMAMCIAVDADILRDGADVAFAGTVASTDGDVATLSVDRWFHGDEVDEVTLSNPDASAVALIGGFELEQGEQYLITAMDGNVRSCGLSGPATPELTELFESAFG